MLFVNNNNDDYYSFIKFSNKLNNNLVIRTSDTDVLVIAIWCMGSMRLDIKLPFAFSLTGSNFASCSKCKSLFC